ncbi:MAG TPA: phosphatase PAP2 family protein [Acidimicrobiia bacterium]
MGEAEPPNPFERIRLLDKALFQWVADRHAPLLDRTLPKLSLAASYSRLWMAIAALIAVLYGRPGRRAAAEGMIAIAVTSAVANLAVKPLVKRRRPRSSVPEGRRLEHPGSTSFPSGHSASAAAFAGAVGAQLKPVRLPLNTLAALVGFSRVYTGVHYPGDVVVGWLLGRTVAAIVRQVSRRLTGG